MDKELKELVIQQQELLNRYIFHKMSPAYCTDKIKVFESREEYDNFVKLKFKIDSLIKNHR